MHLLQYVCLLLWRSNTYHRQWNLPHGPLLRCIQSGYVCIDGYIRFDNLPFGINSRNCDYVSFFHIYLHNYIYIQIFIYISINLSIYLPNYLAIYSSINPTIYSSNYPSFYISIHLSIHLPIYNYPLNYPSFDISFHLSIHLPTHPPIYLTYHKLCKSTTFQQFI